MTVPEGWAPHDRSSPLTAPWEPLFARCEIASVKLALEIRPAHTIRADTSTVALSPAWLTMRWA